MERLYRDNRLNPIHEGSHGIHGLDLLGRKVNLAGGATLAIFEEEMQPALEAASGNETLAEMGESLSNIWQMAKRTTETVNQEPDTVTRLSSATPFLDAFGHVVIAWLWLRQALIAQEALQNGAQADADFYEGKVAACQFFYRYHLPQAAEKLRYVASQDSIGSRCAGKLVYRPVTTAALIRACLDPVQHQSRLSLISSSIENCA